MERKEVKIIFVINDKGEEKVVDAPVGLSLLEVAHQNEIDLEGACEGSLACATCHVIVDESWYHKLVPPLEEEDDMLDLAFGLTSTSRLGCQVIITENFDGLKVKLPSATRNINL